MTIEAKLTAFKVATAAVPGAVAGGIGTGTLIGWIVGAAGAIIMAGTVFWMRAVHSKLESMDSKLGVFSIFQGRVDQIAVDHSRRIAELEERLRSADTERAKLVATLEAQRRQIEHLGLTG